MLQSRAITLSPGTRVVAVITVEKTEKATADEPEAASTRFLAKELFDRFKKARKTVSKSKQHDWIISLTKKQCQFHVLPESTSFGRNQTKLPRP